MSSGNVDVMRLFAVRMLSIFGGGRFGGAALMVSRLGLLTMVREDGSGDLSRSETT